MLCASSSTNSPTSPPRAYLIDSSIYIFRAWHIFDAALTDARGRPSNAAVGFSEFLWQLIQKKRPRYLACAFDDSQTRSYRRELYPGYKANREPAPPELRQQFQMCRDLCRALGVPAFGSDRYEADDIIGTLAARLRRQGFAITVVSADKDLAQLITGEEDRWWDFARGTELDRHGVKRHFGVRPQQIADMLAISGDKIDNIPGVPGIGYKMAAKILQKYDCVESVLENLEAIGRMKFRGAPRVQALLRAHGGLLPLNKRLTTLVTDMELAHGDLGWRGVDESLFGRLCEELSICTLIQKRWRPLALPA
jgi:DNA polymerase-1